MWRERIQKIAVLLFGVELDKAGSLDGQVIVTYVSNTSALLRIIGSSKCFFALIPRRTRAFSDLLEKQTHNESISFAVQF